MRASVGRGTVERSWSPPAGKPAGRPLRREDPRRRARYKGPANPRDCDSQAPACAARLATNQRDRAFPARPETSSESPVSLAASPGKGRAGGGSAGGGPCPGERPGGNRRPSSGPLAPGPCDTLPANRAATRRRALELRYERVVADRRGDHPGNGRCQDLFPLGGPTGKSAIPVWTGSARH